MPRDLSNALAAVENGDVPAWTPNTPTPPRVLPIEWFASIEPQLQSQWLVKRLIPAEGLALLYGHPGSGKSFFALDISLHVALGWEWAGRRVKQGLVVYVGAEGLSGLRNRLAAFRINNDLQEHLPFALIPTPIDLQAPDADTAALANTIRAAAELAGCKPALVVIDTLSKTFGAGKENTDDMASYVANCGRIAAEFKCCVMPVHHRPKDAESIEPRGHSSLKGGVDTVILIEAGQTKKAIVTKQKDGELGETMLFNLGVVELGHDEDGEPVTSCVVQMTDRDLTPQADPFLRAVGKLSAGARLVYDELGDLLMTENAGVPSAIPDKEIDRRRVGKVTSLDAWRDKSISAAGTGAGHSRDAGKKAFNRALLTLRKQGIVRVWEQWAWITHSLAGTSAGTATGHDRDTGTCGTHPLGGVPLSRPATAMILAPGETGDEPIPGWED